MNTSLRFALFSAMLILQQKCIQTATADGPVFLCEPHPISHAACSEKEMMDLSATEGCKGWHSMTLSLIEMTFEPADLFSNQPEGVKSETLAVFQFEKNAKSGFADHPSLFLAGKFDAGGLPKSMSFTVANHTKLLQYKYSKTGEYLISNSYPGDSDARPFDIVWNSRKEDAALTILDGTNDGEREIKTSSEDLGNNQMRYIFQTRWGDGEFHPVYSCKTVRIGDKQKVVEIGYHRKETKPFITKRFHYDEAGKNITLIQLSSPADEQHTRLKINYEEFDEHKNWTIAIAEYERKNGVVVTEPSEKFTRKIRYSERD